MFQIELYEGHQKWRNYVNPEPITFKFYTEPPKKNVNLSVVEGETKEFYRYTGHHVVIESHERVVDWVEVKRLKKKGWDYLEGEDDPSEMLKFRLLLPSLTREIPKKSLNGELRKIEKDLKGTYRKCTIRDSQGNVLAEGWKQLSEDPSPVMPNKDCKLVGD